MNVSYNFTAVHAFQLNEKLFKLHAHYSYCFFYIAHFCYSIYLLICPISFFDFILFLLILSHCLISNLWSRIFGYQPLKWCRMFRVRIPNDEKNKHILMMMDCWKVSATDFNHFRLNQCAMQLVCLLLLTSISHRFIAYSVRVTLFQPIDTISHHSIAHDIHRYIAVRTLSHNRSQPNLVPNPCQFHSDATITLYPYLF